MRTRTELRGHAVRGAALDALRLGETTPADIQARFGEPDARAGDGALTYRFEQVAHTERRVVGVAVGASETVERHEVTFRFERGALAKICRRRS